LAKYSAEKFERSPGGLEQKVAWVSTKHVHNTKLITAIEIWLPGQVAGPGTWTVRKNSYQPDVGNSAPTGAIEYT